MAESIRIENVIICYPHLYEKHAPPGALNAKYGAEFLLHPQKNAPDCERITEAFKKVATEAGKGDKMQYLKSPLKSGDELNAEALAKGREAREELKGMMVLRGSDANYAPAVVSARMQPISEANKDQIFGGCIVNAFVDLFWSSNQANPGVFCGLRGVQLVDNVNVTPLGGGGRSADQMFKPVEGAPEPQQPAQSSGPSQEWM